jgi:RNA polymerase sigma factor (sigma-70 family)
MDENTWLVEKFEAQRSRLRAVAYRMLGSLSEADDAVQDAWLHVNRAGTNDVKNLGAWLTTIVARICLDMLRSRKARREDPEAAHVPDPIVSRDDAPDPEQAVLLADSVGLALLVVLETLEPAERLAFVLHDLFGLPFEEIAGIVGRSLDATRQLASRGRRRVQGANATPDADVHRQREVVNAFLAASRAGDFDALVAVLDPDVVLRADQGAAAGGSRRVRGAATVANQSMTFQRLATSDFSVRPALVNGAAGLVSYKGGRVYSVLGFTVAGGRIVEIDILADPDRLARLDLTALG